MVFCRRWLAASIGDKLSPIGSPPFPVPQKLAATGLLHRRTDIIDIGACSFLTPQAVL
jgi:hypothetical protein